MLYSPVRNASADPRRPQIEYKGKGYFGGKSHQFKAVLSPPGSNNAARTFEGLWHTTSRDAQTGGVFHDVQGPKEEVTVAALDAMGEWESRRLWRAVARGIRDGDFEAASREKSKIEVRPSCVCLCVRVLMGA